ncbi:hypothetical protein [Altericroceibacterium spongiae]|uniref:hypothetical protein n=1 Tax=Altericroceibacterium spongiae TaxID=2320269 RepID=UPI0015FFA46C|nr:hypothetical protein [Altericroceibacterium spongiae]
MYDRQFFTSKLGLAAIASMMAMIAFNIATLGSQLGMTSDITPNILMVGASSVELA